MPIEMQAPDGTTLRFPDGTPQSAINKALQNFAGRPAAPGAKTAAPNLPTLNLGREAGFGQRLGAAVKMTPEGRAGFLEETTGLRVLTDSSGREFLFDPLKNEVFPVDVKDLTLRDIADVSGPGIEAAGAMAGGPTVLGAVAGAAGGNIARQAISAALPGEDNLTLGERALDVGTSAVIAGSGQGVVNVGKRAVTGLRNIPKRMARHQASKPLTAQTDRLGRRTGIEFSFGERTGSRGALLVEGVLRRHPMTSDRVAELEARKLLQATRLYDEALDRISAGGGEDVVGDSVKRAFNSALNSALKLRRAQAKTDFGAVDAAAKGARLISPGNTVNTFDDLIARFDVSGGGDQTAALVAKLKRARDEIAGFLDAPLGKTRNMRNVSANQMQRLLEVYGGTARGTGQVFKDIDKAQQRMIAGEVFKALQRDLDDAVEAGQGGVAASLLRTARDNYRVNSGPITDLRDSALGRIFGTEIGQNTAPETIAAKLRGMKPSDAKQGVSILQSVSPETAQLVKRNMLEDALERSFEGLSGRPNALAPNLPDSQISPAKFINNLRSSPVWDLMSREERFNIAVVMRAMDRFRQKAGEGSPTAPLLWAMDIVKSLGAGVADPVALSRTLGAVFAPRKAFEIFFTPEGQQALTTLVKRDATKRSILSALLTLGGVTAAEPQPQNVRPDRDKILSESVTQQTGG